MSFLRTLYNHNRFKILFTSYPDIVEIFSSIGGILLGIELSINSTHFYNISSLIIPSSWISIFFIFIGVSQYLAWYSERIILRRIVSFILLLFWIVFLAVILIGSQFNYTDNIIIVVDHLKHDLIFLMGFICNMWIYLRLGLPGLPKNTKFNREIS